MLVLVGAGFGLARVNKPASSFKSCALVSRLFQVHFACSVPLSPSGALGNLHAWDFLSLTVAPYGREAELEYDLHVWDFRWPAELSALQKINESSLEIIADVLDLSTQDFQAIRPPRWDVSSSLLAVPGVSWEAPKPNHGRKPSLQLWWRLSFQWVRDMSFSKVRVPSQLYM